MLGEEDAITTGVFSKTAKCHSLEGELLSMSIQDFL
jgi:hypothetical protein